MVEQFVSENNLDLIICGHQVVEDGYEFFANQCLLTIFSTTNYNSLFENWKITTLDLEGRNYWGDFDLFSFLQCFIFFQ
ncbi:hypothetical protein CcCBS67573_g04434 [Chytriomyces confervae]|uniref:protein-serine/threonine phosphatase n=1 Tax=Chytriomyces confervae TaxID=246404 RepID=A0A507FG60_9FUNG|nr:hypothetical protein CcCBS67573_g04434 [Chytriomyces confervae]